MIAEFRPITFAGIVLQFAGGEAFAVESGGPAFVKARTETKYADPIIGYDERGIAIFDDRRLRRPVSLHFHLEVEGTDQGLPVVRYKMQLPDWFKEPTA